MLVYHRPAFRDRPAPASRPDLMDWLAQGGAAVQGKVGTYDIERSAVGFLLLARDHEHFLDIWQMTAAMGQAGVQQFATSQQVMERVADGRLLIGYNILGSYAADWVRHLPDVGLVLPRDFTVVVSQVGLVPRAAARPDLGARFLGFLMSATGQTILAEKIRLPAVSLAVVGDTNARGMHAALGAQLRPVAIRPACWSIWTRPSARA